jgi:putative transposase
MTSSSPPASGRRGRQAGAARWAYNWGLACKQESYLTTGKRPSAIALHRKLNALKLTDLPGMYEVSKCAPQEAARTLDSACAPSFRRGPLNQQGKGRGKVGSRSARAAAQEPQRKSRQRVRGSCRLTSYINI